MKKIDSDKALRLVIYAVLTLVCLTIIYPFWNLIVISLNTGTDTARGGIMMWPREFTWENYKLVFKDNRLVTAAKISVLKTVIGTGAQILFTSIFAYGISRRELKFKNFYMKYALITMYVSGGLIPSYILIRTLHLINTFWVYVVPAMFSAWNMVIFKSFFENLPEGLLESAKIDGAGEYMTFFKIVVPISGPVFASLILFTAVDQWNGWFEGAIYITNQKLIPLQTLLKQIISANTAGQLMEQVSGTAAEKLAEETLTSKSLSTAAMFVTTIPIIMVYPFLQKYFVGGMMVGSIKE